MKRINLENYTKLFKVLGNPIRLQILMHIAKCKDSCHKHNISELAEDCNVDFSVVSRHLKELKETGILSSYKSKNDVIYEINRNKIRQLLNIFSKNF